MRQFKPEDRVALFSVGPDWLGWKSGIAMLGIDSGSVLRLSSGTGLTNGYRDYGHTAVKSSALERCRQSYTPRILYVFPRQRLEADSSDRRPYACPSIETCQL